jgi:probable F420-dependent oxidoreductase
MKTKSGLRLGISLPQSFPQERLDLAYLRRFAQRAEALGFEDAWQTEGILNKNFVVEPLTYIAYLAAVTERLRFGIAVIILNNRNPVQLAKAIATVDHLSSGRLTIGVGIGAKQLNYAAFGVSTEHRVARFEQAIEVMKALWTQERATVKSDFWKIENVGMQPRPLQKPHVPLIFGGHSEPAQRRALKFGDGWMAAGSNSVEESVEAIRRMRALMAESGRDPSSFMVSKRIYLAVDNDEAAARRKLSEALSYQYAGRDQSTVGLAATPSRAVEVLCQLRDAGINHLALNPCYDHLEQMELLADKVIPQL